MSLSINNTQGAPTNTPESATAGAPADKGAAPKVGTAEYEAWVEEQAQGRLSARQAAAESAESGLLLGKFKTPDDLAKAYESLQAEYTRLRQGKAPEAEPAKTPEGTPPAEPPQTSNMTLDRAKYTQEILQSGALSEASYKELETLGFGKDFVDTYIEGQKALVSQRESELKATVGGPAEFQKLSTWAAANLSDADLELYNAQVTQGGASAKMALTWLKSQYDATYGQAPKSRITGDTAETSKSGFKSREEAIQAQRDPRYARDPAYRSWHDLMLANRSY